MRLIYKFEDTLCIIKHHSENDKSDCHHEYDTYQGQESDEEGFDPSESIPESDEEKYTDDETDDESWDGTQEVRCQPDSHEHDEEGYESFCDTLPERNGLIIAIREEDKEETKYREGAQSNEYPEGTIFTSKICLVWC